jgi:hypothetical protein
MKNINTLTGFALRSLFANGTGAGFTRPAGVLAAVAMALVPHMARAQTVVPVVPKTFLVLDDFTQGPPTPQKIDIVTGSETATYTETQNDGHIIGGTRAFQIVVNQAANNPYSQPLLAEVVTNPGNGVAPAFFGWFGFGALGRIYLQYGSASSHLNLKLTGYDRLRVFFSGLTTELNFNIAAFQGSNNEAGACGINLAPYPAAFSVDFPLSAFSLGTTGVDWSDIELLEMIFQDTPDLAISGFYAIPTGVVTNGTPGTPDGPATFTCAKP